MKKLFLLDAYALIFRAYYALIRAPRINSKGMNTSAVFGFVNTLEEVLKKEQPDYIGVAFDPHGPTFRHEAFPQYKAQREETPEGIRTAVPYIKKILEAYRIPVLEVEGFEADDVIGTLSYKASKTDNLTTFMMTLDKDYGQLVRDNVIMFKPQHGSNEFERLGPEEICQKYGLQNQLQVIDMLGLMGDSADNIPGCPGVGPKTAIQLLEQYGSIEGIIEHSSELKGALKKKIEDNIESIRTSKWLAEIRLDVPVELNLEELKREDIDEEQLKTIFDELEFHGLMARVLGNANSNANDANSSTSNKKQDARQLDLFDSPAPSSAKTNEDNGMADLFASNSFQDDADKDETANVEGIIVGYDLKKYVLEQAKKNVVSDEPLFDTMLANYILNSSVHNVWTRPSKEEMTRLTEEMKKQGTYDLFTNVEMPLLRVLARMEMNGVKIDTDSLKETSQIFTERMNDIEKDIFALSGTPFNISSPRQVGEILFDKLKLSDKAKKTKTGQYITSEEVLQGLKGKHEIVDMILDYRGYKKLLSTYIDALPKLINPDTGHVHTTFNQAVTVTGRLSSSNPNLQNIPIRDEHGKEVRKAFIPDEGCLFFSADYSQIELRIMAHLSGDENLIEAFEAGNDIHAATAAKIFKKPIEEISPDERRKAKTANFGIIYGISTFGLAERMQVPRLEAKELIDGYFATYQKVKEYMDKSIDMARDKGYTETIMGRRCYLPDINSHNSVVRGYAERNAINAPIQGSAADIIKIAMINVDKRMQEEKLKSKMILQVHDELNFSVLPEEKDIMQRLVIDEMQNAFKLNVPLIADCGWGKNWLEAH